MEGHLGLALPKRYPAVLAEIMPAQVAAFSEVVGESLAACRQGEQVPAGFAAVYCLKPSVEAVLGDPSVGIELGRLIHADQTFEFHSQPEVGSQVEVTACLLRDVHRMGARFLTVEGVARSRSDGRLLCRSVAGLLIQ